MAQFIFSRMSLADISLPHRDPPEPTGDEPDDFEFVAPKIYEPVCLCVLKPSFTFNGDHYHSFFNFLLLLLLLPDSYIT